MSGPEPSVAVHHAPSLAGGPLRLWNRLLQALAHAHHRGSGWRALLVLDENLVRREDRCLRFLTAAGDPKVLEGPADGVLRPAERDSLAAALRDNLPPAAEAAAVIDRLLPQPGEPALEAAARLWRELLGEAGLEVRTVAAGEDPGPAPAAVLAGPDEELPWEGVERIPPREITWLGPRHLRALRELGLEPEQALAGEKALRAALVPRQGDRLQEALAALRADVDRHLKVLEAAAEETDPALLGAWTRLRRELRRSLQGFQERADRHARSRRGIRGARVHALAQGLRPGDRPQEEGLSLLMAAAAFGLVPDGLHHLQGVVRLLSTPGGVPSCLPAAHK